MEVLNEFIGSKKFWAGIGSALAVTLIALVPALEPMEQYITEIVALAGSYMLGQGLADFGKHAKE